MKKSMKKFMIACAAISTIAVAAGMSAMAADISDKYDAEHNSIPISEVTADEGTQKTVLVIPTDKKANVEDADIYYIDQADTASFPTEALLKDGITDGTYSVLVGYYASGTFTIAEDTFTIGNAPVDTQDILMGDINFDEEVDAVDAQQILRFAVKGTGAVASDEKAKLAADVNVDEEVDAVDAQQVLRYAVKGSSGSKAGQVIKFDAEGKVVE